MTKKPTTSRVWVKPRIVRLGGLKDVKGGVNAGGQGGMS
jgi:hypothetical protein